jgi:hypothetical protein
MYDEEEMKRKQWELDQRIGVGQNMQPPARPELYQSETPSTRRALSSDEIVEQLFTYNSPDPGMVERMQEIREIARLLAKAILRNSPRCADQSAAIRLLRESVMTINAAIVLHGLQL